MVIIIGKLFMHALTEDDGRRGGSTLDLYHNHNNTHHHDLQ